VKSSGLKKRKQNNFSNNNKMKFRIEKDTMGEVQVPADKYWGTNRTF
jgi:hypothetical protein